MADQTQATIIVQTDAMARQQVAADYKKLRQRAPDRTVPGGRYKTADGRLVNALGKEVKEQKTSRSSGEGEQADPLGERIAQRFQPQPQAERGQPYSETIPPLDQIDQRTVTTAAAPASAQAGGAATQGASPNAGSSGAASGTASGAGEGQKRGALPEDFPARDKLVDAGLDTFGKVRGAKDEEILALEGVGDSTLEKIRAAAK